MQLGIANRRIGGLQRPIYGLDTEFAAARTTIPR